VLVGYISLDLVSISATSNTPILQIDAAWLVVPLTIGLALTTLFAIERLTYVYALRDIFPAACVVALLAAFVYAVSVMPPLHPGNGTALGLMLIAQDIPFLQGPIVRLLGWMERKWLERQRARGGEAG